MSGSRFHPYMFQKGTESDRNRKNSGKSATATTSHQATSSIKMLSQSTSSTIKSSKLPNRNPQPVPLSKAAATALGQAAASKSAPKTSKSAPTTPVSSRPPPAVASKSAPSTRVASRFALSTAVASRPSPGTLFSLQPAASVPLSLRIGPSTPFPGLAAYPYWSMAQSLYAMEHQRRVQLQQHMWLQQQNLAYMAPANNQYQRNISQEFLRGTSQEYLRGTGQEFLRDNSQEYLRSTSQEFLRDTGEEYLRGTSKENLRGTSEEEYPRGTSQENLRVTSEEEYLGYMNELRNMCVLPPVPTPAAHLSYFSPIQDHPLNLSLKDGDQDLTHSSPSSSYSCNNPVSLVDCFSPENPKYSKEPQPPSSPSLKLHPTRPIVAGSLDPEVAKMFPHLRTTDMGSIVLWNFLWALLADDNYKGIIRWIDRSSLQFEVVHPLALAKLWGTVKKNKTMNWQKLIKVINLYLSKNILKQGKDKLKFQFILVPQSPEVKTDEDCSA